MPEISSLKSAHLHYIIFPRLLSVFFFLRGERESFKCRSLKEQRTSRGRRVFATRGISPAVGRQSNARYLRDALASDIAATISARARSRLGATRTVPSPAKEVHRALHLRLFPSNYIGNYESTLLLSARSLVRRLG